MRRSIGLLARLLLSATRSCIPTDGFLLRPANFVVARSSGQRLASGGDDNEAVDDGISNRRRNNNSTHRWKHEPFDFSSKYGWDDFYRKGLGGHDDDGDSQSQGGSAPSVFEDGQIIVDGDEMESLEYEWHPHIGHSVIVDAIQSTISMASEHYHSQQQQSTTPLSAESKDRLIIPSILLVGCGNSALPRILHDAFDAPVRVTCLDYSPVCIDMIESMYGPACPNMDFVVGDATRLREVTWGDDDGEEGGGAGQVSAGEKRFDVIVDKGLMDALMCGEGFDMESFMRGMNDVLTPHDWGALVLICFPLSKASKQSLVELGHVDGESSLTWDFDIPVDGSEDGRGCFNLARRSAWQDASPFAIEQITTEWI